MNTNLKIGKETLLNIQSIEYEWIRTLVTDGNSNHYINHLIQQCLGASPEVANTMRLVALREANLNDLLQVLN